MLGSRFARRRRLVPVALTTAALSSALLGASVTGTLSAFNASITNSSNTAASGSLVMRETGPDNTTTCLSSSGSNNNYASCSTINKYGGTDTPLTPGSTAHVTSVKIANTGNTAVQTFVLHPDVCTKTNVGSASGSNSLCDSLKLTLTCTPYSSQGTPGTTVSLIGAVALSTVASNGDVNIGTTSSTCIPAANGSGYTLFTFSIAMPSGQDNTVQGQQVSQPLTWQFTGA